ncbi:MAG: TonB-dependent receptor, partial [Gammaproteobacteria bacterium]|nr:TonB-dependent receptor [Gammaproteobacteria bacterium]
MRFLPITAASAAISIFIHSTAALASPLETVVVTASRTAMPLAEVGSSVTVINSDELEDRQAVALSEILRDVPGFAVSRNGVLGSSTQIRVRGAEGNHVMVMIDGVEANDMAQGDEFNFAHLLAGDVDRIEIIRGPQSALWGSDALAGAVNIITRRGAGPAGARGYFEAGSFATLNGGASLSAGTDRYDFHLGGNV